MLMPMLAVCLVASLLGAPDANATDDPFEQTDGLWVGHELGKAKTRVTIELRGTSMVILDQGSIGILTVGRWELAGPGGKGGDIQLDTTAIPRTAATRAGKAKAAPKNVESRVRLRLWSARKAAVMCVSEPRKLAGEIRSVPAPGFTGAVDPGVTCYDLTRAWPGTDPVDTVAPWPNPHEPDFECMRECRQQNMMRAVGAEVIEADCRAACTKP